MSSILIGWVLVRKTSLECSIHSLDSKTKTMKKKRGRPEKPKSEKVRQFPFYSTERKINEAGGLVAVQKRIKELLN